jgi:hypothetical protein
MAEAYRRIIKYVRAIATGYEQTTRTFLAGVRLV